MNESSLGSLRAAVEAQPGVAVAYLFGSRATGRERPDSDLDLAIGWDAELDARDREIREQSLRGVLGEALGAVGEQADIVDLGRAGAALAFRVIRDGILLFARDRRTKIELEARIARRYDDEAPYRALFRQAARRAGRKMKGACDGRP